MKIFKKSALAILIATLAFGFSAFTTLKKSKLVTYYKVTSILSGASNPAGYVYFSDDHCNPGGALCSAVWDIGSNPAPIADNTVIPSSGVTYVPYSVTEGHFEE
ncbi:MAG: hypothetical protein V4687_11220 [Bacteroidota bacterium]